MRNSANKILGMCPITSSFCCRCLSLHSLSLFFLLSQSQFSDRLDLIFIENSMSKITLSSVWYSSQLGTIFFSLLTAITSFSAAYPLAYLSITISLAISLYQSLTAEVTTSTTDKNEVGTTTGPSNGTTRPIATDGTTNLSPQSTQEKALGFINLLKTLVKPARKHPTTPYVLLSVEHLFFFPRFTLTLFPFVIFAFFHAINYTRTFVLPLLPIGDSLKSKGKSTFEFINSKYNEAAFRLAVWVQLVCFTVVFIWAVVTTPLNIVGFGDGHLFLNWFSVFGWFYFINVLQSQNLLMKSAINQVVTSVDGVVSDPRVPQQLRDCWARTKHFIRYKDLNHAQ